uniref:hypothetical protein n=2 Tax=Pannonibacter phragmitetus TaxID=121719 RepID=UPI000B96F616|nr:hypothetical protein [Pannonibacter phragmitetus]
MKPRPRQETDMKPITENMQVALNALPLTWSMRMGKMIPHNFPAGVTKSTIDALRERRLITVTKTGSSYTAKLTSDQPING